MTADTPENRPTPAGNANKRLAFGLLGVAGCMVGLSFAAVPLYRAFCQATGYGGTTQRAETPSEMVVDRAITVRFDASISSELDWSFQPVQRQIALKIGENVLAFYKAVNRSDETLAGTASFNVTPEIAGSYFIKVECFCFTEQTLQPHQSVDMPVSFYIDPAIMDDPDARRIEEITLSYTFFRAEETGKAAHVAPNDRSGPATIEKTDRSG